MGPTIIARNYAATLLELARRQGGDAAIDEYAEAMRSVAELLRDEPAVGTFLATPRVTAAAKKKVLRGALDGRVPEPFLRFLLVVIEKRRQRLLGAIAVEYAALVDEIRGRVRADVVLARAPDAALEGEIVGALERRAGRKVVARFRVDPAIVGGVVVRIGDETIDGSLRRRIGRLRRRLLTARIPHAQSAIGS